MSPEIERVTEGCVLGEAPHWVSENEELYFVDIFGKYILRYSLKTGQVNKASTAPKQPTFIVPVEGKNNHFIVALDNELAIVEWDGQSDSIKNIKSLCAISSSGNKFNDGKCDSSGRLWAGGHTLAEDLLKTQPLGALYSFDSSQKLKSQVDQIRIANGLAFDERLKKMYFIDSLEGVIFRFDFDITTGTISNKLTWFTLSKFTIPGMPDGMTIDTDGNLWVAIFGGGKVLKVDGNKPETLLQTIDLPAPQVTSMVFGGKNLDELYVTTGAYELMEGQKLPPPDNGATYRITNTGSKGFPSYNFKMQ